MSFYQLPHPWNPGYAIPKYVMGEPPERGTFTTEWLPRGTIPDLVPEYFAKPGEKLLGRADADLGSLSGSCLGGSSLSGHTLKGSTLRGSSLGVSEELGATTYNLVPLQGLDDWKSLALVAGAVGVGVYLLRKRKRRRSSRRR